MHFRSVIALVCLVSLAGCLQSGRERNGNPQSGARSEGEPGGFSIMHAAGYRKLTVFDPWQKSVNTRFDYILVNANDPVPSGVDSTQVIRTPLHKVICLSTTHIGFISLLGADSTITGLSGGKYVSAEGVRSGLASGKIADVGYDQGLNYELIIRLKPDVVFAYGVGAEVNAQIAKLKDLGIRVVMIAEYLEKTPLARAGWIRVFGTLLGREKLADSIYTRVRENYLKTKEKISKMADKPAVLTGLPFRETWWIAGGQSHLAVLIRDAGGKFLWEDNPSAEAFPVSLEEVYTRAARADYWINCGTAGSLGELKSFDPRFSQIPAVQQGMVYNNNLRLSEGGGNDYWESGVVRPDLLLADLASILHPGWNDKWRLFYYRKLE